MFSNTNLKTQDRFTDPYFDRDNDFVSPNNKTKPQKFVTTNTLSSAKFQPTLSKISHLIQMEDEYGPKSRIIPLLSSSDGTFHFHDDAANVLNRYSHRDIVFIGIWGAYTGDKSYFYDKILNLCGVSEAKYSESMLQTDQDYNMVFYQRPFIKQNLRIFLVDCRGYNNPDKLRKSQKVQLDILMSICEIVILVETPPDDSGDQRDVIDIGYGHFNESFQRLYVNKAQDSGQYLPVNSISWPKSLFVLYSDTQSIKRHQQLSQKQEDLRQMFSDFNFSLLHTNNVLKHKKSLQTYISVNNPLEELYLKNSQSIFLSIYRKLSSKVFNNLKCTGFTSPLMIMQLVTSLNNHNSIFLPKVLQKVRKNVYGQVYNRNALNYVIKLKDYIQEQKAYSDKYLLTAFKQVYEQIMEEWDWNYEQVTIHKKKDELYENYEEKLQKYIEEKQKNLLYVNHKKSIDELTEINRVKLKGNKAQTPVEKFINFRNKFENQDRNYDANAEALATGNSLKYLYSLKNVAPIEIEQEEETHLEFKQKHKLLQTKKIELSSIIQDNLKKKETVLAMSKAEENNLRKISKEVQEQIEKCKKRIDSLKNMKQDEHQRKIDEEQEVKQILEQLEEKEQDLKEQLKTSIMVRNKLFQENDKAIMQKSQVFASRIDEKKNAVVNLQKTIFESKVRYYTENKIAEKRKLGGQSNGNLIRRSKLF